MLLVLLLIMPAGALAGNGDPIFGNLKNDPKQPWHIVADQLTYDDAADQYIGKGHVVITKQGKKLTADFVQFQRKSMDLFAAGHVVMTVGNDVLSGDRMEMNLETETGTVYDGSIFIHENHFYISGASLQKLGEKTYAADTATVTTCKGDRPDWKITGKNIKVTMEGIGVADHATLWAGKVPVLYTPYMVFPLKSKRQSGLLFPQIGYSDRKGFEYHQPYFWAINESSDATFYAHHMEKRGEKFGMEYRYVLDEKSQGAVMADGFEDRQIDDGTSDLSNQWGYPDDNAARPNSDRYWFRMKHDQTLPLGFTAKLDLDLVSDQDYLHEFKRGYAGFDETDAYFHKYFGRDLDDYDDPVRLNRLNLNKSWSKFSLNAEVRWYDDVINRRLNGTNPILQKLPFVEFDASKQQIVGSPVYMNLDSEYVHFYRKDGESAHRVDIHPRAYLPLNVGHYFTFEPSFGVRETFWYQDRDRSGADVDDDTHDRFIYDVKADLSSEIYKIFRVQGERLKAVRHIIRPRIVYDYIPGKDQSELPRFDGLDRIGRTHTVTYSITNTFTSKSLKSQSAGHSRRFQPDLDVDYTYREFCRLKIEQSYDINEANEDDPAKQAYPGKKQPFSPIFAELNFAPFEYFSMKGDVTRSLYNSFFESHNVAINLKDKRGDRLFIEHRYRHNASESLYADLRLKLSEKLTAYTDYEKNLLDAKEIKTGIGFFYQTGCWSIDCSYTKEADDRQFAFMINLFGLGEFGKTFGLPAAIDPVEYN